MATVKTAISVPRQVLAAMDDLAHQRDTSRSALFTEAARAFLARNRNLEVHEALNAAYADGSSEEEREFQEQAKRYAARKVIEQW